MRWESCREKQRQKAKELEQGEGKKMALREKEHHKINLRKGIVEETLVE